MDTTDVIEIVVSLAKFKSNRDYEREVRRRSAAIPQRAEIFRTLTSIYERIWYGWHEPSENIYSECEGAVHSLKTC
jgi:hypothetical protein